MTQVRVLLSPSIDKQLQSIRKLWYSFLNTLVSIELLVSDVVDGDSGTRSFHRCRVRHVIRIMEYRITSKRMV
jgi:hypothetical protein